jgi:hypothetical protein
MFEKHRKTAREEIPMLALRVGVHSVLRVGPWGLA